MSDAGRDSGRRSSPGCRPPPEQEAGRETIVGTAGWVPFDMTVPGGEIPVTGRHDGDGPPDPPSARHPAPDDRRQIDDVHARRRGRSEAVGLGIDPSTNGSGMAWRRRVVSRSTPPGSLSWAIRRRSGTLRMLDEPRLWTVPSAYERIHQKIPASFKRSRLWWEARTLSDSPRPRRAPAARCSEWRWRSTTPEGYALYEHYRGRGRAGCRPPRWRCRRRSAPRRRPPARSGGTCSGWISSPRFGPTGSCGPPAPPDPGRSAPLPGHGA